MLWKDPQVTSRNLGDSFNSEPESGNTRSTNFGEYWLFMSPCPSLPNQPAPKVSSSPLLPIKAVWSGPQLTFFTRTSVLICLGKLIALRIMLEPWPNLPHSALPHVYTSPPGVMPAEWSSPAATELAFAKAATKVGSLVSVVVPRPQLATMIATPGEQLKDW